MTPEERDRLVRVEATVSAMSREIGDLKKMVDRRLGAIEKGQDDLQKEVRAEAAKNSVSWAKVAGGMIALTGLGTALGMLIAGLRNLRGLVD